MFKTILFYNFYQKKVENCLREKISDKYPITWSIVTREALSSLTKISPRNNSVMTWEKSVSPPLRLVKCCGVFIHSITAPQNIVCFQGSHLSYYLFLSIKSEHMFVMIFGASFWVVSSFVVMTSTCSSVSPSIFISIFIFIVPILLLLIA